MSELERLRETLAKIAEIAGSVAKKPPEDAEDTGPSADVPSCSIKSLPKRLIMKSAQHARGINPMNAPMAAPLGAGAAFAITDPMRISVLTTKYWGPTPRTLTVSFMETTPKDLRARILSHMNAWSKTGCFSFAETSGTGDVRISREGDGYWSYLGTDVMLIPKNRPTMNLQEFSMATPESEYKRVVRHETGHTLGFPHEHMRKELVARIDPQKAYTFFLADQGWDKATVDEQVLTPLDSKTLIGTPADQTSIMCYQLPASITKDGKPILGGVDINATDARFAGLIYPRPGGVPPARALASADGGEGGAAEDWPESDDVDL